jgi:hypothetical protein
MVKVQAGCLIISAIANVATLAAVLYFVQSVPRVHVAGGGLTVYAPSDGFVRPAPLKVEIINDKSKPLDVNVVNTLDVTLSKEPLWVTTDSPLFRGLRPGLPPSTVPR